MVLHGPDAAFALPMSCPSPSASSAPNSSPTASSTRYGQHRKHYRRHRKHYCGTGSITGGGGYNGHGDGPQNNGYYNISASTKANMYFQVQYTEGNLKKCIHQDDDQLPIKLVDGTETCGGQGRGGGGDAGRQEMGDAAVRPCCAGAVFDAEQQTVPFSSRDSSDLASRRCRVLMGIPLVF